MKEKLIESFVRLFLSIAGFIFLTVGWLTDWRGFTQGLGSGMLISLLLWNIFWICGEIRNSKP